MPAFLTRNDMAAMVSMAAMVGIPIQSPERGLIPATIAAIIIVLMNRAVSLVARHSESYERILMDQSSLLIENGTLKLDELEKTSLSRELVFSQLRSEGVRNLGKVKSLQVEPTGSFSLMLFDKKVTGLSLIPMEDKELTARMLFTPETLACVSCGQTTKNATTKRCPACNAEIWANALLE